ncbi:energy-coupling factor transport system permease protein [Nocardioides zeae]|uniref:Energy-coupling factor transport system permease protein n=2 Tax=Nocardioides zeae TaxID=1457234 RepID=A0ACC6IKZ2_9ACTN|nr:energy-coupling factor transporter transmembrane component T [Nocardioides zeae]MDQ1105053.1 energy-coupling factor transport system permease protein [Nocardioides zeae]MDR6175233.1 energy-coupling factor transport system permease protein [Nocardioides zeae]MDR6211275.1 energy-coupling factor transport system permease protein [Nocardioides zeae]
MSGRAAVARLPRELHPLAWWGWAVGLAAAASTTSNPYLQLLLVAVACVVVVARRTDHPWARVFHLYLAVGALIVVLRVLFRLLVGGAYGTRVLVDLPEIPLPDAVLGIQLLGPVTQEALLGGLYDGLRLATIVICVGAANALANPKRLMASMPAALYEVGTALVVAVNVMPQLAQSVRRVRAAQRLRPSPAGRARRWTSIRRVLVPVLEDALDRSLALAAGMDTRGYGRSGTATRAQRLRTGALMLGGMVGIGVGVYGVLDLTAPRWLALPMLALGVALAVAGMVASGRRVGRTRYRPAPWRWPEVVVVATGVAVLAAFLVLRGTEPRVLEPDLLAAPVVSVAALAASLLGLVALLAPPPPGPDGGAR